MRRDRMTSCRKTRTLSERWAGRRPALHSNTFTNGTGWDERGMDLTDGSPLLWPAWGRVEGPASGHHPHSPRLQMPAHNTSQPQSECAGCDDKQPTSAMTMSIISFNSHNLLQVILIIWKRKLKQRDTLPCPKPKLCKYTHRSKPRRMSRDVHCSLF
jgi:hypothetical protein